MKNIKIRDAKEEDAPSISALIYETEEDPSLVWGQGSKEETLQRINWLVKSEDSRYSYKKAKVAEYEGKVCGAIILLRSEDTTKLDMITSIKLLSLIKGVKRKIHFIKDMIMSYSIDESGTNELYIANVATSAEVRGLGVGKTLMKVAEDEARKNGCKRCSLLAKDKNVKKFYEKLDYKFQEEQKYLSHSLYKMIKLV